MITAETETGTIENVIRFMFVGSVRYGEISGQFWLNVLDGRDCEDRLAYSELTASHGIVTTMRPAQFSSMANSRRYSRIA